MKSGLRWVDSEAGNMNLLVLEFLDMIRSRFLLCKSMYAFKKMRSDFTKSSFRTFRSLASFS